MQNLWLALLVIVVVAAADISRRISGRASVTEILTFDDAPFLHRALAYLVDWFFVAVIQVAVAFVIYGLWERLITSVVIANGYCVLYWTTSGATPGKKLMRLKVVDADTGQLLTPGTALLRSLAYVVSGVPLGLGFAWALLDDERQTWHDKIAGTRVVRAAATREERTVII